MPYYDPKYDRTRIFIENYYNHGWTWEDLHWASRRTHSEDKRKEILADWQDCGMLPLGLTVEDWCNLVELVRYDLENHVRDIFD